MKNMNIQQLKDHFKGKGGDGEAESILNDSNMDKKKGTVSVWSNKVDAFKILERCSNSVISFQIIGDGIQMEIDRKAFRGIHCAFRNVKAKTSKIKDASDKKSIQAKERMSKYWANKKKEVVNI